MKKLIIVAFIVACCALLGTTHYYLCKQAKIDTLNEVSQCVKGVDSKPLSLEIRYAMFMDKLRLKIKYGV